MQNDFHILIDSDAFVGLMMEKDAHHAQATGIFEQIVAQQKRLATTSAVVAETATVLSHRSGQDLARTFLEKVIQDGHFPVIFLNEILHQRALETFLSQSKRGTSVTDCANVVVSRQLGIPAIFSFDQAYPKYFDLPLAIAEASAEKV